jgi:hypothetical protein
MPDCPDGSQIKPSVTEDKFWIAVGDALEQLEGVLGPLHIQFLAQTMQQVAPSLIDLENMCAHPPRTPSLIDFDDIILSGQWASVPQYLVTWFWDTYCANRWQTFCECIGTSGSGPCPPIPPVTGDVYGDFQDDVPIGPEVQAHAPFNSATVRSTVTGTGSGDAYIRWRWYDASHALIRTWGPIPVTRNQAPYSITLDTAGWTTAERNAVRYARPWGSNQSGSKVTWTYTTEVLNFVGTCNDVTVTPPPPDPPPPPPEPTEPLPPAGPIGCSTDTLCAMLYQLQLELRDLVVRFNAAQKYGLPFDYVPGTQHGPLTAGGSFTVGGLCGIRVDIGTDQTLRQLEGTPPYLWDLGWMSIMTPEGMIDERRITRDGQVWQPRMIQEATTIGYFFKEGITGTITELWPEPY